MNREKRIESIVAVMQLSAYVGAFFIAAAVMFGVAYVLGPESINRSLQPLLTTFLVTYALAAMALVRASRRFQYRALGRAFPGGTIQDPVPARAPIASRSESLALVLVAVTLALLAWYLYSSFPESALDAKGLEGTAFLGLYALLGRTGATLVMLVGAFTALFRGVRSWPKAKGAANAPRTTTGRPTIG